MRAPQFLPHRHWPSGRQETLGSSIYPAISFTREVPFRRLIRSLSLRPYSLLASRADRTRAAQRPPCPPRLLRPGFQIAGSPYASAGYDYGAKLRIAPAGLSPASTAASLAAPCLGTSRTRQAEIRVLHPHRLHRSRRSSESKLRSAFRPSPPAYIAVVILKSEPQLEGATPAPLTLKRACKARHRSIRGSLTKANVRREVRPSSAKEIHPSSFFHISRND